MSKEFVVYGAGFCANCKPFAKKLSEVTGLKLEDFYRDVDDYEDEVSGLGIRALPHVIVKENGQEIFVGRGPVEANKVFGAVL